MLSEGVQLQPESDLSTREDATLFQLMAERGAQGEAAWAELYGRHVRYLYFVCTRSYAHCLGRKEVEDLVQDVFLRAYEKAGTFSCEPALHRLRQQRAVRAWLGTIAANLVCDRFRKEPMMELPGDEFLELCETSVLPDAHSESDLSRLARQALETLDDREQDVLRTSAQWYQPGAEQQRLPNKVMTALAKRCNTSPGNIRQIRLRASAKVRRFIEQRAALRAEDHAK